MIGHGASGSGLTVTLLLLSLGSTAGSFMYSSSSPDIFADYFLSNHRQNLEDGARRYFVPQLKYSAKLATLLFDHGYSKWTHGLDGVSSNATKDVISDLTGELRWRKEKYDFLNKHDASFEQAVIKIHYAAFIHNELFIINRYNRLDPPQEVNEWAKMVIDEDQIRLGKVLSDLNKAVQGIDRGGQSVIFTFKGKKEDESAGSSICQTMHEFRDYLTALQTLAYSLLATAMNVTGWHKEVHELIELALERLMQQEKEMGAKYNDWFGYGTASCSYQISQLKKSGKCIGLKREELTAGNPGVLRPCLAQNSTRKGNFTEWIYNKISLQIVPRSDQSYCLQRSLSNYNNGNPVILKKCNDFKTAIYGDKWSVESSTGQIKHFASYDKCLTARGDKLMLWDCSDPDCLTCDDKFGDGEFQLYEKLTKALKFPLGDLNLVEWQALHV